MPNAPNDYSRALAASDPVAASIALAVLLATSTGWLGQIGVSPEHALEGAALLFIVAAGVRAYLESRARGIRDNGGILS